MRTHTNLSTHTISFTGRKKIETMRSSDKKSIAGLRGKRQAKCFCLTRYFKLSVYFQNTSSTGEGLYKRREVIFSRYQKNIFPWTFFMQTFAEASFFKVICIIYIRYNVIFLIIDYTAVKIIWLQTNSLINIIIYTYLTPSLFQGTARWRKSAFQARGVPWTRACSGQGIGGM